MHNLNLSLNLPAEDQAELQKRSQFAAGDIDSLCVSLKAIQEFALEHNMDFQVSLNIGKAFAAQKHEDDSQATA